MCRPISTPQPYPLGPGGDQALHFLTWKMGVRDVPVLGFAEDSDKKDVRVY